MIRARLEVVGRYTGRVWPTDFAGAERIPSLHEFLEQEVVAREQSRTLGGFGLHHHQPRRVH